MVIGRILQGIGLSAPRTMSIAIIRDMYSGDYMARIMSFVTVVFILVPVIAPAMGKFILDYYNWHGFSIFRCSSVFWFLGGFGNDNQRLYLLKTRKIFNKRFYRRI
jgi:DHA1 family bicyclomycin/chloramphenicol resistance-like MFS transporter